MLLRIVRMEFQQDKVENFLEIFHSSRNKIEQFEGCRKVELFRDSQKKNVFFTHSLWDSEVYLNNYRASDFFKGTWSKTKKLFTEKPMAFSLVEPE